MNTFNSAETAQFSEGEGNVASQSMGPTPIRRLLAAIYRQHKPMLAAIGAAFVLGLLVTLFMPRQYTSVASVLVEKQAPQAIAVPGTDQQRVGGQEAESFLQTQMDLVHSRTVATGVANQLKAADNAEILSALGISESNADVRKEAVLTALMNGVQVTAGLNTRLAKISFESRNADASAKIANAFAQQLVVANMASKADTSLRAADYLKKQLADAKEKLEASERSVLNYARKADLSDVQSPDSDNGQGVESLRAQLLGQLSGSLAEATSRRIVAQQQWQQIKNLAPMSVPQVQENRAVQDLIAEKAKVAAEQAAESDRYTKDYPSETSDQLKSLNSEIQKIAVNIKQSFHDNYVGASKQEQAIHRTINGLRALVMAERERSVGYASLQREADTNKAFYEGLLQRYKEVVAAADAPSANVTVVDQAEPATSASSPNLKLNMAFALMLGLIVAVAIGLFRERMRDVVRDMLDLGRTENLPLLGIVPTTAKEVQAEDAIADPQSTLSEAYNSIAVSIQKMAGGHMPGTLLVTSSAAGEGKSTTAVGAALSLARMGKRVLLVDADFRRPSLHTVFTKPQTPGFSDALDGSSDLKAGISHLDDLGIDFLPAGKVPGNPVGLIAQPNTASMIEQLASDYDIVILDGAPVMGLADAIVLSDLVEAVALTVEANRSQTAQLRHARLRLSEAKPVGGVLTKFDARAAGVAYGGEPYFKYA